MTLFPVWLTFGDTAGAAPAATVDAAEWAFPAKARPLTMYPSRVRGSDVWILAGDIQSSNQTGDTWDLEE